MSFNKQLLRAFIPVFFLVLMLFVNIVYVFQNSGLDGSNQIILLLAAGVVYICARSEGTTWDTLFNGILQSIETAMPSLLILLMIGALGGTWLISGIIPSMVYYGLKILNPNIFLVAACIISAIISIATGSSWATIATVGIALLGMSRGLGINPSIAAGAIISGAYFGDKMSPLSDTTNLAPVIAGTNVFTHIRFMVYTTLPSIFIAIVIFFIMGFFYTPQNDIIQLENTFNTLKSTFYISPVLFIAPVLVLFLIIKKQHPVMVLFIGSVLGGITAIVFQQNIIQSLYSFEDGILKANYTLFMKAMYGEIQIITDNKMLNQLFKSTGMAGMLNTIWLILCAMIFGGAMQASGFLKTITTAILKLAKTTTSLVISTVGTCLFCNITISDQYLAIIVPGKMFSKTFEDKNLKPEGLSRTLEDSATVTSVLVPWNTCGATQQAVLGIATFSYLPYCFFNIISPFMTIAFSIFFKKQYEKVKTIKKEIDDSV